MTVSRRARAGAFPRLVAGVGALVLALAGCASIPSSGAVKEGDPITSNNQDFTLDYIPGGPVKNAGPGDILRGFVEASSSPQGDYAIARKYLTPALQSTWNPDDSVTVDQGSGRDYTEVAPTSWQLSVSPVAEVDASGGFREAEASTPVTLRYQFIKGSDGQWRISAAPNGVVIDATTFKSVFSSRTLYFFDPSFSTLVPDLRWFPARVSTPTRIVKALLAGPSKWLGQGAVATAFPQGTQLTVDSVPAPNGLAEVDLNDAAGSADQVTLERMKYQLQRSLLDGTSVGSVQVLIDGAQQNIPDLSGANLPVSDPQVDPRPLVDRGDSVGFASASTLAEIPGLSRKIAALHPSAFAVSATQDAAAVLTTDGVFAVRTAVDAPVKVDARPGLIAPAIDGYGFIWTVPAASPGALMVTSPQGVQAAVSTGWTGATKIVSLQVSRDGTRVIALLRSGAVSTFVAAAVIRGAGNVPTSLGQPLEMTVGGGTPISATWVDQLTVAVLATTANGETLITTQQIGGASQAVSGPTGGTVIVGATATPAYWVLTSAGSVQAASGTGWQERVGKVSAIATQLGAPH